MELKDVILILTVILTSINVGLTFYNIRFLKRKEFQDKLYNLKLDAYNDLNESSYEILKYLDINSDPLVKIYDYDDKTKWEEYWEKHSGELISKIFQLKDKVYKYSLILPNSIVDQFYTYTGKCTRFVATVFHFDQTTIVNNQDELWDLYTNLLIAFKQDLNIDKIDKNLTKRV